MAASQKPAALDGRYAISRKIADGGMAEIFLATQLGAEGFERPVILKRILPALSSDPQFRHMLVDEAHIAMSLHHGNIVQVLDLGEADGRTFLVLELVDGWDLQALLERARRAQRPLPDGLCVHIVAEVCRALAYAHGKTRGAEPLHVVHRDVSPQNVLVSEQGEVKLTDFGIAKALGRREQTRAGVIKGKLAFMSPEQAAGAPLDARSDVFSAGSVLYTMLTGAHPFSAPSDLEALLRVQSAEHTPASRLRPDLPAGLTRILDQAMKKTPSARFGSAEEMMLALEEVLRGSFAGDGQSALKRWLAGLAQADGAPPASRMAGLPTESGAEALPGKTLALASPRQTPALSGSPRVSPPGEGGRTSLGLADTQALPPPGAFLPPAALVAGHAAPRPRRRGGRTVMLGLVGLAGLAYWQAPAARRAELIDTGRRFWARATSGAPVASQSKPETAAARPKPPAAAPPAVTPAGRQAEPEERERRVPTPALVPAPVLVKIRFESRPSGAAVRSKTRVRGKNSLGRTPFELSLPAGTTFEATFTKAGYAPETRAVVASPTGRHEVRASMEPTKERSRRAKRRARK